MIYSLSTPCSHLPMLSPVQIFLLQLPFGDSSLAYTSNNWFTQLAIKNSRPPLPVAMDSRIRAAITSMWVTDPAARPEVQDVLDHFSMIYEAAVAGCDDGNGQDQDQGQGKSWACPSPNSGRSIDGDNVSCDSLVGSV